MSAVISEDGRYRYELRRSVSPDGQGIACFIGLNASTADGERNDPSVRRMIGFARDWGYGELLLANSEPLRATDPRDLLAWRRGDTPEHRHARQVNLDHIASAVWEASIVVAAWGVHVQGGAALRAWIEHDLSVPLHVLGLTKHGYPRHPLYVRADTKPVLWSEVSRA